MRYMVIERFKDARAVYRRLRERGRMMPQGLTYLESWISADLSCCFQLMEADGLEHFDAWIANWSDLVEFEVIPVQSSAEAATRALAE